MTYLLAALLGLALGYFLAVLGISRSIQDDLAQLEADRLHLDRQRAALEHFLDEQAEPHVRFDLGAHRRLPEILR